MAKPPETWTKSNRSMSRLPRTCSSAPRAPSMSSSTLVAGPVTTSSGAAAKFTTVPSLAAWLMFTSRSCALRVSPSTPTKATSSAPACSAVHLRPTAPAAVCSRIRARAKSPPVSVRPSSSAVPPLMPAKASTLLAPTVSRSTSTTEAAASLSVTWVLDFSKAKPPSTWKKPNRPRLR